MPSWLKALPLVCLGLSPQAQVHAQSPQFRGNPQHIGVVETLGVERFGGVAWRFETGGTVRSSVALVDGTLFVGSSDGFLYALDAESGRSLWAFDTGAPIASSPAVSGGTVLVGSRDGVLHGLSAAEGRPLWRLETGPDLPLDWGYEGWDYILSSPVVVGSTAYWGSGDGHVYAVAIETGEQRWRFRTGGRVRSTPAVADNLLVVGNSDGFVYALDAASGAERWRFETAGATLNSADFGFDRRQVSASPAIADEVVYIGSRDASLYALDASDGTQIWSFDEDSSWVITTAAVTADHVFSGRSSSGNVRAIDRETGREVWSIQAGAYVYSSPVVVDGTLYIGQGDGDFVALDAASGEERWGYRTGAAIYSTPVVHQGRVYVGSDDGFVYAFSAAEGLPLERAVFFDEALRARSVFGSADPHLMARDYFVDRGYRLLDSPGLTGFLEERVTDGAPSVVVFAMDGLPEEVAGNLDPDALLRRYLDAGGKVVWMGYPPGFIVRDEASGQVVATDRERPAALLGVSFDAYLGDSHGVTPTETGRRWGLTSRWVGSGSALPSDVSQLLATDELGRAAAWVQSYGGPPGSGFVLLRATWSLDALAEIQRVAEFFGPVGGEAGR